MAKKEEIAELIADHFGRSTIDADYELAAEILRRVGYDEDDDREPYAATGVYAAGAAWREGDDL